MITITLPDGSARQYEAGITPMQVAESISSGLARNVLVAKYNDVMVDSTRPMTEDGSLTLYTWNDKEGKSTFWHSSAHIMAEALEALYPGIKLGIGPPIENGFYYDIDFGEYKISDDDLPAIEKKMTEMAQKKSVFTRSEVSKKDARAYFTEKADPYKLELIEDLSDGEITFYNQGDFTDLCRGPHIPNTGLVKAIKLMNVAGAYWRGDENNKMLTRIYGVTFPKKKELDEYLVLLEEAKKRDHRKLGKQLELFTFSENVGAGLPLWMPKGTLVRERLQGFLQEEQRSEGYQPVITPHIAHKNLYMISGHYEKYGSDSFQPILTPHEGEEFLLKPMNCPHHCEIYKAKPRTYKELPLRLAEFGTVYRYEQSGELHGLTRVRGFTQDDSHLFCTPDQVKEQFKKVIDLVQKVLASLDFQDYTAQVSLRDQDDRSKYIGEEANWEKAEKAILEAVEEKGLKTVVEYGEAAFYGPKLDFMVKDAIGRSWQLGTIQVDYNLPERFELEYIDSDNTKKRPVMIHRAPFGSMERFVGVLLEHCEGNLPVWLCPEQVRILPISDNFMDYAQSIESQFREAGIDTSIDDRAEKIGRKIRDAEVAKIPYMCIIGEKETEAKNLSVRRHGVGDFGSFEVVDFIQRVQKEINNKQDIK